MTLIDKLYEKGSIQPPRWLPSNLQYLTIIGSEAYGVSSGGSDIDFVGFCIPPKENVFPHLAGEIPGFGKQLQRFEQWQQHHVPDCDGKDRTYDFTVFSIVKFFQLCMENNPNMIDALFTPRRCVTHSTQVSELVRENRKAFLHKGAWQKFKGYAYAQMSKIAKKSNSSNLHRARSIEEHGYDLKFAYHVVRLLNEVEQILIEQDLDLERNREQLKSIRRGDWTLTELQEWFQTKERQLEATYFASKLPQAPDETALKRLLLQCLEAHYGTIEGATVLVPEAVNLANDIRALLERHRV